jgi:hypothetical protein
VQWSHSERFICHGTVQCHDAHRIECVVSLRYVIRTVIRDLLLLLLLRNISNVLVRRLTLLLRIRGVPGSNSVRRPVILTHPWWWRQYAPLKRRSTIILHGSTSQKTALNIILAAVRTWNLTIFFLSSSRQMPVRLLKFGHDRFLTHPFPFIIHIPTFHSTLYSLSYWEGVVK